MRRGGALSFVCLVGRCVNGALGVLEVPQTFTTYGPDLITLEGWSDCFS